MVLSFDLYFRKNPFAGEFTIFGGLEECIRFIANFKITEEEIKFLRTVMPTCEVGLLVLSKTCILLWEILHYVIFVPSINMLNCAHLVIHDSLRVVWQSTNLCFPPFGNWQDGFFEYLSSIDCSDVEVYAIPEGYVVFPKVPLMRIEGPVAVSTRSKLASKNTSQK